MLPNYFFLPYGQNNQYKEDVDKFISHLQSLDFPANKISPAGPEGVKIDIEDTDLTEESRGENESRTREASITTTLIYGNVRLFTTTRTPSGSSSLVNHQTYTSINKSLTLTPEEKSAVDQQCIKDINKGTNWWTSGNGTYTPKEKERIREAITPICEVYLKGGELKGDALKARTHNWVSHYIKRVREIKEETLAEEARDQLLGLIDKVLAIPGHGVEDGEKYRLAHHLSHHFNQAKLRTPEDVAAAAKDFIVLCIQRDRAWGLGSTTKSGNTILKILNGEDKQDKQNKFDYQQLKQVLFKAPNAIVDYYMLRKMDPSYTHTRYASEFFGSKRKEARYAAYNQHIQNMRFSTSQSSGYKSVEQPKIR